MQEELQTKIMRNSYDLPFPIVDYYPFINPDTPKKITEEGRKQMAELQKYATELMEKYNIKFDLKCANAAINPEKDV